MGRAFCNCMDVSVIWFVERWALPHTLTLQRSLARAVDLLLHLGLRPQPVVLERRDARSDLRLALERGLQSLAIALLVRFRAREPRVRLLRFRLQRIELRFDRRELLLEGLACLRLALARLGLDALLFF